MAAIQRTSIAFQPKSSLSSTSPLLTTPRTLSFSFSTSTTFPSLTLNLPSHRRSSSAAGVCMMVASAAGSYALALADIAKSNNTLDATAADVEKIEKLFSEPNVSKYFTNLTIDDEKKRELLDEVASSSALQPHTANFLNILVEAKRTDLIKDIVKEFEAVYNRLTDTEQGGEFWG